MSFKFVISSKFGGDRMMSVAVTCLEPFKDDLLIMVELACLISFSFDLI